jgi:hypothetical protein
LEKGKNVDKLPHARPSEIICVKILSKIKNRKEEYRELILPMTTLQASETRFIKKKKSTEITAKNIFLNFYLINLTM